MHQVGGGNYDFRPAVVPGQDTGGIAAVLIKPHPQVVLALHPVEVLVGLDQRLWPAERLKAYRDSFQELKGNRQVCATTVAVTQNMLLVERGDLDHIIEAVRKIRDVLGPTDPATSGQRLVMVATGRKPVDRQVCES